MDEHTYKILEITGSAKTGTDDAIRNALAKAHESIRNINWFKVVEHRGYVEGGEVQYWQVTVKIGFRVED